jgi:hypothetical protein
MRKVQKSLGRHTNGQETFTGVKKMASKFQFKTTAPGVANYPYLTKPDYEFDEEGKYSVKLIMDYDEKAMAFCESLDEAKDEHVEKMKAANKKVKPVGTMYEVNEEEGTVTFNINMRRIAGKGKDSFEKAVKFFDAKGKYIGSNKSDSGDKLPAVNPGSTLSVNLRLFTWLNKNEAGLRLEPEAVQIIKQAKSSGRDAAGHGFGTHADGFEEDDFEEEDTNGFSDQSNGSGEDEEPEDDFE